MRSLPSGPVGRWLSLLIGAAFLAQAACNGNANRRQDHVLDRIGYGPDTWSRNRVAQLGLTGYIEEQLAPASLDDTALDAELASLYPVTTMTYADSRSTFHEYTGNPETGPWAVIRDGTRAKLLRSVKSKKQLEQVLVDFWYNHFSVDANVEEARWGFLTMERDAIRPYVFGKFEDMLRAVAQNPGMLDYLDNALNMKEGYVHLGYVRGINENYARELLELHTVGVDGGYTQQDVREVARAFTGWTLASSTLFFPTGFQYLSTAHDKGAKTVMGLALPANRQQIDGFDVLHFLALQPQTAERVSRKLCQRFVSEQPPAALVQAAKTTYLNTQGDLREVMRTILLSNEFMDYQTYGGKKVKRPLVFVASLARAVGVTDDATFAAQMDGYLQRMGESLFRAGPPTGYPESSAFWSGEGPFVERVNVAWRAAHAEYGFNPQFAVTGTTPQDIVEQLQNQYLRNGIEAGTRQALETMVATLPPAARVQEAAAALFASPDFLLH